MKTPLEWLLEKDNPSVRYFALKHLLARSEADPDVQAARRAIMRSEPLKQILAAQEPEGYWAKPGSAYWPSYRTTAWQVLFLAELGANGRNRQVHRGCEYLLKHAQAIDGGLSVLPNAAPRGVMYCHSGNLTWALIALGYDDDERIGRAIDWLAGAILGEDFDGFHASSTSRPGFCCAANNHQPCAWGAVKALRVLTTVPTRWQSPRIKKATGVTVEFLLSRDLAKADYPYTERVNGSWFKFGFPLSYTSDVLEASLTLCEAGYAHDARLKHAIDLILAQRAANGCWVMQRSLNGKMWADIETKGQPSKWVTLRALRVLKAVEGPRRVEGL
jgi:hypothetical protein